MSVENFKKFGQICAEDVKVRQKVKEIGIGNIDGWIAYSKSEFGLEFDKRDIQALADEIRPTEELSDEELEQVAGGVVSTTLAIVGALAAGVVAIGAVGAAAGVAGGVAIGGVAAGVGVGASVGRAW